MKRSFFFSVVSFSFASLAGSLSLSAATTEELAAQPGILLSQPIFLDPPYAQCHASSIVETPQGLVATWFGGTKEGDPDVVIYVSRHVNGAWTPPVEVAHGGETENPRVNTLNPVLFQVPSGPLLLFYRTGKWWPYIKRSTDGGKTWSKPERLYNGVFGPVKNKPVLLSDGSILSPASTEYPGVSGRMWRVQFERSVNKGSTWQVIGPVNDGLEIDAIQPSILFHPGKRLQALGRTSQGRVFEVWSEDEGKTWGKMTLTDLPNPNCGTDALTLSDGRHLLVYNHTNQLPDGKNGPRSPLNVAISSDGKNWQGVLVLENQPGEFSYPAIIQTKDGLVHITYTWKRRHIRHVVVDPAKLVTRPLNDPRWPTEAVSAH
jgi:predicted neuraminidase